MGDLFYFIIFLGGGGCISEKKSGTCPYYFISFVKCGAYKLKMMRAFYSNEHY